MRILFLSRWFPHPVDNGSKIRIFNLLKTLRTEHEVVLLAFAEREVVPSSLAMIQMLCSDVRVVPYHGFQPTSVKARLGFFAASPRSVIDTFSPVMHTAVQDVAVAWQPDIVIASQIDMAPYALAIRNSFRVLEELELAVPADSYRRARGVQRVRKGLTWWKLAQYLRRTLPAFDLVTVVSARERDLARQVCPDGPPVEIVPNGADWQAMQRVQTSPTPGTLIYNGALSYYANYDAVQYFLSEIFPRILKHAPATRLLVTGSTQGVAIDQLPQHPHVEFTGYLEDVWPAVAGSWVAVVPLRLGGGTRLKVIEALALGTPVVATSKGVEGLDLHPDVDVAIADDPQTFAEKTLALLHDADLRARVAAQGRRTAAHYDWAISGQILNRALAAMMRGQPQQSARARQT
ncbi:MAG TPA: glycosyl transferase family 1 [Chloroflexi bacterium]|nr:glycosyl transferase family 1 [Chloroflexota bacterium]HHW87553.1 glycosyltransferase [Chloroflexota bacterium]